MVGQLDQRYLNMPVRPRSRVRLEASSFHSSQARVFIFRKGDRKEGMVKIYKYESKPQKGQKKNSRIPDPLTKSIISSGGKKYKALVHQLIRRLGGDETIYLMELVFRFNCYEQTNSKKLINGYFPVSVDHMIKEFGFKYDKQNRIKKKLKKAGLIDFRSESRSMNKELVFSVNIDAIKTLIEIEKESAGAIHTDKRFQRQA